MADGEHRLRSEIICLAHTRTHIPLGKLNPKELKLQLSRDQATSASESVTN